MTAKMSYLTGFIGVVVINFTASCRTSAASYFTFIVKTEDFELFVIIIAQKDSIA